MIYYLKLQLRRIHRKLIDVGENQLFTYLILALIFIGLSEVLLTTTNNLKYAYPLIVVAILLKKSSSADNDFLKLNFSANKSALIGIIENTGLAFPFMIYSCIKGFYQITLIIVTIALAFIFYRSKKIGSLVIPTPFWKIPFEFIIGFRLSFWILPFLYFLAYKAIEYDNLYLGLFSIYLIYALCSIFTFKQEDVQLVKIFNKSRKEFLIYKALIATGSAALLCLPSGIGLLLYFPKIFIPLFLIFSIGSLLVISISFAKYTSFPDEINLKEGLLSSLSIIFPFLIIFNLPYFWYKANKSLEGILHD